MHSAPITSSEVELAADQLAAAESQIVVDGLTADTADTLRQARANSAMLGHATRVQERRLVIVG